MKRRRRRLFVTPYNKKNIGKPRTPFYEGWESKSGGWPKLKAATGGRVGGDFWKERPSDRSRDNKGDYNPVWQIVPIREGGRSPAKKRLPKLALPMRRRGNPKQRAPIIRGAGQESRPKQKNDSVKLLPMRRRGPMVTKRTQVNRPPDKVASSMTNAANKFHKDGVKTGSKGYAGATKPALTSSGSQPLEPMSLERKSVKISMSNNSFEKRTIHHMKFKTGFKPTNPVFRLAKDNGTTYQTIIDTKMSWQTDTRRQLLNHACGFNSKCFIIPPRDSFISVEDVLTDVFDLGLTATTSPDDFSGTRYGALMSCTSQFMIHNQSAFMPCKIVAHLCHFTNPQDAAAKELCEFFEDEVFNPSATVQRDGAVPIVYQHAGTTIEADGLLFRTKSIHADMSYKGKGLYDSTRFRNSVSVVKSESVRLEAGDFLNLTHTHECGPGVDLGKLHDLSFRGNHSRAPFSFFVIFELQGYECEGLYKSDTGFHTYLGKSPAYISWEFKKSFLGARAALTNITGSIPTDNVRVAVRDFTSESVDETGSFTKEKFVLPENIRGSSPTVAGQMSITVSTDKTRVSHTTTSPSAGTEANP